MTLEFETEQRLQVKNITPELEALLSEVEDGLALIYTPHTTAALLVCEDDEELREDMLRVARTWLSGSRPFRHNKNNNPNAEAHILSSFAGTSVALPVVGGKLDLGRYQNVLFLELDGPRRRQVKIMVMEHRRKAEDEDPAW